MNIKEPSIWNKIIGFEELIEFRLFLFVYFFRGGGGCWFVHIRLENFNRFKHQCDPDLATRVSWRFTQEMLVRQSGIYFCFLKKKVWDEHTQVRIINMLSESQKTHSHYRNVKIFVFTLNIARKLIFNNHILTWIMTYVNVSGFAFWTLSPRHIQEIKIPWVRNKNLPFELL